MTKFILNQNLNTLLYLFLYFMLTAELNLILIIRIINIKYTPLEPFKVSYEAIDENGKRLSFDVGKWHAKEISILALCQLSSWKQLSRQCAASDLAKSNTTTHLKLTFMALHIWQLLEASFNLQHTTKCWHKTCDLLAILKSNQRQLHWPNDF